MALGEAVRRRKALLADAEAVAEETMRRARCNIELLISRLAGMGYRFAAPAIERELETIQKSIAEPKLNAYVLSQLQKAVAAGKMPPSVLNPTENPGFKLHLATLQKMRVALEAEIERMATMDPLENPRIFYFYPPEEQTAKNLKATEKVVEGPLPLSIRSWYRHVGYVSFAGAHPVINPDGFAMADPLVVRADDLIKARLGGGKHYTISIPNLCADVDLENEWRQTTFVHYLRKAFEWAGFPGWERDASAPRDAIAQLADGLRPI